MNKKINISIIGTRGYPYIYSGYETFVKHLSERLVLKDCNVTIYCHRGLFKIRPKKIKGIKLVYIPTIETKILSQPIHSFFSIIHACFSNIDVVLVVNSANGPFGLITRLFKIPSAINVDGLEWQRFGRLAMLVLFDGTIKCVLHERAFAATGDASHEAK